MLEIGGSEVNIYDLKLHERTQINNCIDIMRVPGGWLYETIASGTQNEGRVWNVVFVPFDNEFQEGGRHAE